MNLEELENNWREYALIGVRGNFEILALDDVFESCKRSYEGLIFISKNGICCYWNLRCDEDGNCYRRISFSDS